MFATWNAFSKFEPLSQTHAIHLNTAFNVILQPSNNNNSKDLEMNMSASTYTHK